MAELPSSETLARLVSNITRTMFGMSFMLAAQERDGLPWLDAQPWRTLCLPIPGGRPLTVLIATDQQGALALGGAMFSCPPNEVDRAMVDDALGELVNIIAGQIKIALGLDQALGLPRVLEGAAGVEGTQAWRSATLEGGSNKVMVWVAVMEHPPV